ncbi:hypothetical protein [Streptomyces sp. NPDC002057]|uniref:hypothetical protein n=1 Tax=Streptomyces sp. NPDC002057 TaxID=3154664 RepID=UPI00332622A5
MKDEAKTLAKGWGFWLLCAVMTADDRHNTDILDSVSLAVFGLFTLVALGMTVRFLYRLLTHRGRGPKSLAPVIDRGEAASESP